MAGNNRGFVTDVFLAYRLLARVDSVAQTLAVIIQPDCSRHRANSGV